MDLLIAVVLIVAAFVVGAAGAGIISYRFGYNKRKKDAEAQI